MTSRPSASLLGFGLLVATSLLLAPSARAQDPSPSPTAPKADATRKADAPDLAKDKDKADPKATADQEKEKAGPKLEKAVFGGGCFWCLEAFFERVHGVKQVVSGYAGGSVARPSYEAVCTGLTGHAEVVAIEYDANVVSYDDLLDVFWICHDPTTLNRQGPDEGTQYRSIILYVNDEQKKLAEKSYEKATAAGLYPNPIVTQLVKLDRFWPAEKYHQDYYKNNANKNPYCQIHIAPKIEELRRKLNAKAQVKKQQEKEKAAAQKAQEKAPQPEKQAPR